MALLIKYGVVRPIGPKDSEKVCVSCLKPQARWLYVPNDNEPWCAHCFLYKTDWARGNADGRDKLIKDIEIEMGAKLTDAMGVLKASEADRVLASVVMVSAYVHGKATGRDESNRS